MPVVKRVLFVLLVVSLAACTKTVTKQPFGDKVSKEREVESRVQIALIYRDRDQPDEAMRELQRAMEVNPKSPRVHEVLALVLEETLDYERAEEHFSKMLRYDSEYSRGRANYGFYLMRRGNCPEAYKHFQQVVTDIYYPRRALVYYQMGICAGEMGKTEEMLTAYRRSVALDNKLAPPLLELSRFAFDNQDYPKAQEYLDRFDALTQQPTPASLLLGIRLARVFNDKDTAASKEMALKNLYPRSQEYLQYLQDKKAGNIPATNQ